MLRVVGVAFVGSGLVLMRAFDGTTVNLAGLAVWWIGVLIILDALLMRDGLPAQLLWAIGVGLATYVIAYTDLAKQVSSGTSATVVAAITSVLGAAVLLRPPRRKPELAGVLSELSDRAADAARPLRPADPPAEVARTLSVVAGRLEALRSENPAAALELARLVDGYRTRFGTHTVETSPQPAALSSAVTALVRQAEDVRSRSVDKPGFGLLVVIVGELRRAAALVVDDTR